MVTLVPVRPGEIVPLMQQVTDVQYAQAQTRHNSLAASGRYTDEQIASLQPQPSADSLATGLLAYSADKRWQTVTGGMTFNGMSIQTDDQTRQVLTSAVVLAQLNPATMVQWKSASGEFVELTADQIIAMGQMVASHTQYCYTTESNLSQQIQATPPTVTTKAQIDDAYASVYPGG
jgi:hypothetical protein